MGLAETADLVAKLSLQGNFTSKMKGATGALDKFDTRLDHTESRAYRAGQQIGTGIKRGLAIGAVGVGLLTSQVALGLRSLVELEQQQAQSNAVIKSTGGIAKVSAAEVGKLAEKYEGLNATIGDEVIRSGQNMLLTFTNIRKKAFEPALEAVLDMNTAMGSGPEGLTKTAIIVGKALNDPIKGMTALRRVGVTFSEQQVKRIKKLQEEGKLYSAQRIILAELNKEFGGSFAAQGDTNAGKVAKFHDAIDDLQRTLATAFLPTLGKVSDKLTTLLADPAVIRGVEQFGAKLAGLFSAENIDKGIDAIQGAFRIAKESAPAIADAARITGAALKVAVDAFKSLPPEIQKLAIAGLAVNKLTGGLVTTIAGGLISSVLKQLVSGVVNVRGATVVVTGGVGGGGVPVAGGGGKGVVAGIGALGAAGFILAIAEPLGQAFKEALPASLKGTGGRGESDSQRLITEAKRIQERTREVNTSVIRNGFTVTAGVRQAAMETQRQGERIVQTEKQTKAGIDASKARLSAVMSEARRETARGVAATKAVATAVRNKDLSVVVRNTVVANLRLSTRNVSSQLTFQQQAARYG